jgi:hypothetical protein
VRLPELVFFPPNLTNIFSFLSQCKQNINEIAEEKTLDKQCDGTGENTSIFSFFNENRMQSVRLQRRKLQKNNEMTEKRRELHKTL